jgi:hypothetical protein
MDQIQTTLEQFTEGIVPEQNETSQETNASTKEEVTDETKSNETSKETESTDTTSDNTESKETTDGTKEETTEDKTSTGEQTTQDTNKIPLSEYWKELGYDSEDTLKEELQNAKQLKEELQKKEESLKNKDDLLNKYSKNLNPLEHFPDESAYKAAQIAKQNPGLNQNALNRIVHSDVNALSDEDAIVLNELLDISDGSIGESSLRKRVRSQFKIDKDTSEMDESERQEVEFGQIDLKREANKAKSRLATLTSSVEIPQQKSIEEIERENKVKNEQFVKELQNKWVQPLNKIEKGLDKVEIPVKDGSVEFVIDDKMRNEVSQMIWKNVSAQGMEPDEQLTNTLIQAGKDELKNKYFDSIIKKVVEHVETKLKDQHYQDTNGTPPNTAEASEQTSEEGVELADFAEGKGW